MLHALLMFNVMQKTPQNIVYKIFAAMSLHLINSFETKDTIQSKYISGKHQMAEKAIGNIKIHNDF